MCFLKNRDEKSRIFTMRHCMGTSQQVGERARNIREGQCRRSIIYKNNR